MVKEVQGLKKYYLKLDCKFANLLASQHDYTVAVYKYMWSLGPMAWEGGLHLCEPGCAQCFDTDERALAKVS